MLSIRKSSSTWAVGVPYRAVCVPCLLFAERLRSRVVAAVDEEALDEQLRLIDLLQHHRLLVREALLALGRLPDVHQLVEHARVGAQPAGHLLDDRVHQHDPLEAELGQPGRAR
eukprot:7226421-Prymnesium_polylepis.1